MATDLEQRLLAALPTDPAEAAAAIRGARQLHDWLVKEHDPEVRRRTLADFMLETTVVKEVERDSTGRITRVIERRVPRP